jgi:DNA-binding CsgD family transcriptional regulator
MSSRLFDGALAVLIGALGVAEIWVPFPSVSGEGSRGVSTVLVLLVSFALVFRRRWPLGTALFVMLSMLVAGSVTPILILFWGQLVPMLVAVFSVARHGRGREPWYGALAAAGTLIFVGAVRAGASGFLLKDVSPDDLVHAVRVVARGEAMLAPSLTRRLLERFAHQPRPGARPESLSSLSERELAVLKLVAKGKSNAEIGAELYLSEATVKTYVSRLLAKLHLRDRVQIAVLAYESGLVQVGEP